MGKSTKEGGEKVENKYVHKNVQKLPGKDEPRKHVEDVSQYVMMGKEKGRKRVARDYIRMTPNPCVVIDGTFQSLLEPECHDKIKLSF